MPSAQKVIASTLSRKNDLFVRTTIETTFKYVAGAASSFVGNGVVSSWGLFLANWKPW